MSQKKNALDILEETCLMGAKSVETTMDPSVKLCVDQGELLSNPISCRRIVGKLNYLTITRPDISFAISVISQFMSTPLSTHVEATLRIVMECMATYVLRRSLILIGLGLLQIECLLRDTILF